MQHATPQLNTDANAIGATSVRITGISWIIDADLTSCRTLEPSKASTLGELWSNTDTQTIGSHAAVSRIINTDLRLARALLSQKAATRGVFWRWGQRRGTVKFHTDSTAVGATLFGITAVVGVVDACLGIRTWDAGYATAKASIQYYTDARAVGCYAAAWLGGVVDTGCAGRTGG